MEISVSRLEINQFIESLGLDCQKLYKINPHLLGYAKTILKYEEQEAADKIEEAIKLGLFTEDEPGWFSPKCNKQNSLPKTEKKTANIGGRKTNLDYAKYFHQLGFNISSVGNSSDPGHKKKAPNHKWQHLLTEIQTEKELLSYRWHISTGLGAFAGINDIRCIDFDKCNNLDFIHTFLTQLGLPPDYEWLVRSGSNNGYHIWLRCKEYPSKEQKKAETIEAKDKALFDHLEYRWNQHIVLPPSIHESGSHYKFVHVELPLNPPSYVSIDKILQAVNTYCFTIEEKKKPEPETRAGQRKQDSSDSIDEYMLFEYALEFTKNQKAFNSGDRNKSVYQLARNCYRYDIPLKVTLEESITRFEESDFTEKEITESVKSAYADKHTDKGKYRGHAINQIRKAGQEQKNYYKTHNPPPDKTDKSTSGGFVGSIPYEYEKKNEPSWPDPEEIAAPLAPVQKLTADMLPDSFRDYVLDISDRMRCAPDFPAVASVIVCGSLIGTRCAINPKKQDNWQVVPNLWGGPVAPPSSLKTPSIAEPLKMLDRLRIKAKAEFEQALREYMAAEIEHEATLKVYKAQQEQKLKNKAVQGAPITTLPDKPEKPTERRYQTNDTTIEKCGELLNENPRGIVIVRDEGTGWIASFEKSGHEQDRAFFLEAWNGTGSQTIDRIGRGTIHVENVCVSVLMGIQPAKLAGYLHNSMGYENDGFVQRLQLLVYPDPEPWELVDRYPNKMAKEKMWNTIQRLDEIDLSVIAYKDEYDKFPYLRFAEDAQEVFYNWLKTLELQKLRNTEEHPIIIEHLAKYRSLMPSLALIFHLIDYAEGKTESKAVSVEAAKMAVKWCDYLETHARRIYQMVTHPASQSAKELSKKILSGKVSDEFTARDIYRKEWYLLNTPEATKTALDYLTDAGWLRVAPQPKTSGRPPADKYLINPKVFQKV